MANIITWIGFRVNGKTIVIDNAVIMSQGEICMVEIAASTVATF
jgi:SOS-response transcriptional repressor LexA